jgi:hypothetical protein
MGLWNFSWVLSEYDYKSLNASLNASRSFAKDNFTLGFGVQFYKDKVSLFPDLTRASSAIIVNDKKRDIIAISITASQILTKKDIVLFGFNYIEASKFLESTASSVLVNGTREVEQLPDKRVRYAISSKWVHGLSETSALNTSYRYYWDKWDLKAHTARIAYLFEYNENEDFIEFFARYHKQSSVKYFQKSFSTSAEFMTSDSDMSKFTSYEGGVYHKKTLGDMGDMKFHKFNFENVNWGNSIVYSVRENGMRYGYFQSALSLEVLVKDMQLIAPLKS